jgi:hypothetical protein
MTTKDVQPRKAFRQGELVFIPLDKDDCARLFQGQKDAFTAGWNPLDTNVIREGEATGHKHEILLSLAKAALLFTPPVSMLARLPGMDRIGTEDRLLVSDAPVEIVHPEHQTLKLPKGIHLIVVQRQYDEIMAQRVRD